MYPLISTPTARGDVTAKQPAAASDWRWKIGIALCLLLGVGIGGSMELYRKAKSDESDSIYSEFLRTTEDRMLLVETGLNAYLDGLVQMATGLSNGIMNGSFPTYEEFILQARTYNASFPGDTAISLVLNITDDRRDAYEDFIVTQPGINVPRVMQPSLISTVAPQRPSYFVTMYNLLDSSFPPIYQDKLQNMDVLPLPSIGNGILNSTARGICGVNRFVNALDGLQLFALFCPFHNGSLPFLSPAHRLRTFGGGVTVFFSAAGFVKTTAFNSAASELVIVMNDTTEAFGGTDPVGVPLILDRSNNVVSISASSAGGQSVIRAVEVEESARLIREAGRMVAHSDFEYTSRVFRFTFAALPEFTTSRQTSNPRFVLGFSLGVMFVLIILFGLMAVYLYKRDRQQLAADMERRLQQTLLVNAAKEAHERTIAYATHQLRNPLQAILGSVGFLKDRVSKDDECYEDVATIAAGAADMARVIDDISDWVKVSVGQLELRLKPVLLHTITNEVIAKHKQYINPNHVTLSADIDPQCAQLYFNLDSERIKQVLTNGLLNSIRATQYGSITIRVGVATHPVPLNQPCALIFKVIDTGCGFGNIDPKRLLQQFYVGSSHSQEEEGEEENDRFTLASHWGTQTTLTSQQSGQGGPARSVDAAFVTLHNLTSVHTAASGVAGMHSGIGGSGTLYSQPPSPDRSSQVSRGAKHKVVPVDAPPSRAETASTAAPVVDTTMMTLRPSLSVAKYTSTKHGKASSTNSMGEEEDTHGRGNGLGIGLPMCKQLVKMMKGSISLTREHDNTVLSFAIPTDASVRPEGNTRRGSNFTSRRLSAPKLNKGDSDITALTGITGATGTSSQGGKLVPGLQSVDEVPRLSHHSGASWAQPRSARAGDDANGGGPISSNKSFGSRSGRVTPPVSAVDVVSGPIDVVVASNLSPVVLPDAGTTDPNASTRTAVTRTMATSGLSHIGVSVNRNLGGPDDATQPAAASSNASNARIIKFNKQSGTPLLPVDSVKGAELLAVADIEEGPPSPQHAAAITTSSISRSVTPPAGASQSDAVTSPAPATGTGSGAAPLLKLSAATVKLDALPPVPRSVSSAAGDVAGMRVLVVDDEKSIRRLCERMLQKLGCSCVLLEDGDMVYDTLLSNGYRPSEGQESTTPAAPFQPFDCVLMDIMMGRSNGVDVVVDLKGKYLATPAPTPTPAAQLQRSPEAGTGAGEHLCPDRLPPIIAMTANTSIMDITNYKRAGFANVLGKPFDISGLRAKLLICKQ